MPAPKKNLNAVKADAEKKSFKGRCTIDLGDLKARIVRELGQGESLVDWIRDACEAKLAGSASEAPTVE